jgi:hypothetical protein
MSTHRSSYEPTATLEAKYTTKNIYVCTNMATKWALDTMPYLIWNVHQPFLVWSLLLIKDQESIAWSCHLPVPPQCCCVCLSVCLSVHPFAGIGLYERLGGGRWSHFSRSHGNTSVLYSVLYSVPPIDYSGTMRAADRPRLEREDADAL